MSKIVWKLGPKISMFFQGSQHTNYPGKDVHQNDTKESMSGNSKNGSPTPLVMAFTVSP